jgi:hypothetical protein
VAKGIYTRQAQHSDNLPAGYPRTDNAAGIRILRRLFSPEDAELAPNLTMIAEPARVVARRLQLARPACHRLG